MRQSGLADSNVQNHERPIFEKRDITKMLDVALDSCLQYLAIACNRTRCTSGPQDLMSLGATAGHQLFRSFKAGFSQSKLEQSACPSAPARPVRPTRCVCLKPANHIRSIGHIGIRCTRLNEMLTLASWQQ